MTSFNPHDSVMLESYSLHNLKRQSLTKARDYIEQKSTDPHNHHSLPPSEAHALALQIIKEAECVYYNNFENGLRERTWTIINIDFELKNWRLPIRCVLSRDLNSLCDDLSLPNSPSPYELTLKYIEKTVSFAFSYFPSFSSSS